MMEHKMMKSWGGKKCGLLILRVVLGVIFIAHGWMKIHNMDGTEAFFGSLGFATFWAGIVAWTEFLSGIGMVLGIFTRLAGFLLVIIMAVVIFKLKWAGGLMGNAGMQGFEYELMLLASALTIALSGPGRWALGPCVCGCCKKGTCKGKGCVCHMMCGSDCKSACDGCDTCKGGMCTGHEKTEGMK